MTRKEANRIYEGFINGRAISVDDAMAMRDLFLKGKFDRRCSLEQQRVYEARYRDMKACVLAYIMRIDRNDKQLTTRDIAY